MEEILLNTGSTDNVGYTKIYLFGEHINRLPEVKNVPDNFIPIPSYITFNDQNIPLGIYTFDGKNIYHRNDKNNFVPITDVTDNFITGYTTIDRKNVLMTDVKKKGVAGNLKADVISTLSVLGVNNENTFVFFEEEKNQDVLISVGLKRTFESIDTLSVYNNLRGSTPVQNSDTGVVFGKLEAIQIIKDTNGNNLRIPLSSVPVGIFNSSQDFPDVTSVDEDGNRLRLNFQPNPVIDEFRNTDYFNKQSLAFDNDFLLSSEELETVPDQYKFMAKTNENGEFILYNVPTGSQTLVFEVDLLKQGLTKEEIALNRFDYPATESPNVDSVPHFFYRQVPIEVLPAWGEFQTGYTELNISVNLDLRKWSTYYFPPISFGEKTIQELQLEDGIFTPLKIQIRDMTKDDFSGISLKNFKPSSIVEIPDPIQRVQDQELEWRNEFAQLKNVGEFRRHDYSILKLPANIYDPNLINSRELDKVDFDPNYSPRNGAWFCGYQFKVEFFSNGFFRATGLERKISISDGTITTNTRDHFHLNRNLDFDDLSKTNVNAFGEGAFNGSFPYERPWNHLYPDQVKIPKIPKEKNPNWIPRDLGGKQDQPKYLDGDLVGDVDEAQNESGGFGLQIKTNPQPDRPFENKFSKRVTRNFVYKYENGVHDDEVYANGYKPKKDTEGISSVINGEKYQRTEAGFGYFLKPQGWPHVKHEQNGDVLRSDLKHNYPKLKQSVKLHSNLDLTLKMDADANFLEGGIDIYRVIDPSPENLISPDGNVTPTFVNINTKRIYRKRNESPNERFRVGWAGTNRSGAQDEGVNNSAYIYPHFPDNRKFTFGTFKIRIKNIGTRKVSNPFNPLFKLNPGQFDDQIIDFRSTIRFETFEALFSFIKGADRLENIKMKLEGNDDFDTSELKYRRARYEISFLDYKDGSNANNSHFNRIYTSVLDVEAKEEPDNYYMRQRISNAKTTITSGKNRKCKECFNSDRNVLIDGVVLGVTDGLSGDGSISWSTDATVGRECGYDKDLCNNRQEIGWKFG